MPASKYSNTEKAFLAYFVLGALSFVLNGDAVIAGSWPHVVTETCYRKVCTPTLAYTVGKIYLQVIGTMSAMMACLVGLPTDNRIVAAMLLFIAVQAKHIMVDGLIPPPPVMVMTAGVFLTNVLKPGKIGTRAFLGFCALNTATFIAAPSMIVTDTWAGATPGTEAGAVGALCVEVLALYLAMALVLVGVPGQLGLCLSWTLAAPVMAKHVLIDGSGPPPAMQAVYVALLAYSWYALGNKPLKAGAEKAMALPMKAHGLIVGTGFLPYFVLEAFGVSLPIFGLATIGDFAHDATSGLLLSMLSIFMAYVAHVEYTAEMKGRAFWMYHIALSAAVLFWQCQPSTTLVGKAFFALPHGFTAWSTYIVVSKDGGAKKA